MNRGITPTGEASAALPPPGAIAVDGRVYATEAANRGMGRYVDYLIELLGAAGRAVVVMLPREALADYRPPPHVRVALLPDEGDASAFSTRLNRMLAKWECAAFVDATPFLPPGRYDICACPVVAVIFDLIPMRYPGNYLYGQAGQPLDAYVNGVARLRKADAIVAISEVVRAQALHYLGIPLARINVIEPRTTRAYESFVPGRSPAQPGTQALTCIQGAHRSKNFPAAIGFLERLSDRLQRSIDLIVPTARQRALVEARRDPAFWRLRVHDALLEARKFELQRDGDAVLHLSLEEGYGIPFAEALLLYRPVIALDTAVNREILGRAADIVDARVLLLDDLGLARPSTIERVRAFVQAPSGSDFVAARAGIIANLMQRYASAPGKLTAVLDTAVTRFAQWHARSGLAVVSAAEMGTCGVSDYSHAIARGGRETRYVFLLGPAPHELELAANLRLLPSELLADARGRIPGAIFNLAVSDSLVRAFDIIATGSAPSDVLVVHDAGSYLPGLLGLAVARHEYKRLFDRYLCNESVDVRALSVNWLSAGRDNRELSDQMFLAIDQQFGSYWLKAFQGRIVSHHPAFDAPDRMHDVGNGADILALLPPDSEIRVRARYVPMPIDSRANPGVERFSTKIRWALGLTWADFLVCCAGSVVGGKHLLPVARVVARLNAKRRDAGRPGQAMLLLAGRILDGGLFASMRREFDECGCPESLLQLAESSETRYDAMLLASDAMVAFREQRRIQMSHSFVRALALGRPVITNREAGFADADELLICSDTELEADLERHLTDLISSRVLRQAHATAAQFRYSTRHTVSGFFTQLDSPHG